jgi:hypothetical protein
MSNEIAAGDDGKGTLGYRAELSRYSLTETKTIWIKSVYEHFNFCQLVHHSNE